MADEYELKQVTVRLCLKEAESLYSNEVITDSDKAIKVMADALREMDREYVRVVNLDTLKHPINYNIVSIGDIDQAQIPIQNIFKSGILSNAKSLLAIHNHPSGSLVPSQADLSVTRRMVEAGWIMGIPVTDHIVVAGGTGAHKSIRDTNPEIFSYVAEKKDKFLFEGEHKRVSVKEKIAEKNAAISSEFGQKPVTRINEKVR